MTGLQIPTDKDNVLLHTKEEAHPALLLPGMCQYLFL